MLRVVLGIALAVAGCVLGFIAADVAAFVSSPPCTTGELLTGLGRIALVGVVTGGVPALVTGFRRIALLPFALGAAGPALIFVAFFFSDESGACSSSALTWPRF